MGFLAIFSDAKNQIDPGFNANAIQVNTFPNCLTSQRCCFKNQISCNVGYSDVTVFH